MSKPGKRSKATPDPSELIWRRASRCANNGCVEVAVNGAEVLVRDSKRADSPVLSFGAEEWRAFVAAVKDDEFGV